jgi:hypothetical protein
MCALCGAFGIAEHWSDGAAAAGERQHRVAIANDILSVYGLKLSDWSGRYTLAAQTGGVAIVDNFGSLWPAAEQLAGRPCDPLDPALLDALSRPSRRR